MRTFTRGDWICDNVVKAIVWRVMVRSCYIGLFLGFLLMILAVGSCSTAPVNESSPSQITPSKTVPQPASGYTYQVINTYPHDREAFTEGLVFDSGILYEGTGLSGRSSLRMVELETGKILQLYKYHNIGIKKVIEKVNFTDFFDVREMNYYGIDNCIICLYSYFRKECIFVIMTPLGFAVSPLRRGDVPSRPFGIGIRG